MVNRFNMEYFMKLLFTACIAALFHFECTVCDTETSNDLCGGFFRQSFGYIDFKINNETVPDDTVFPKICVWTILPMYDQQMQYIVNVTSNMIPQNTLRVNGNRNRTITIDSKQITQASGNVVVTGPLLVVILIIRQLQLDTGFVFNWNERNEDDFMGNEFLTNVHYSWGTPSADEELGPFGAYLFWNEVSTFGFPKGNDTQATGYTFQITWESIEFDDPCPDDTPDSNCRTHDFLMACRILDDGSLVPQKIYYRNGDYESLTPIENPNGFYLIVWTSTEGGGKFFMEYATIRV